MGRQPRLTTSGVLVAYANGATLEAIGKQFGIRPDQAGAIVKKHENALAAEAEEENAPHGQVVPLAEHELCPRCGESRRLQGALCRRCREVMRTERQVVEKAQTMEIRYGQYGRRVLVIHRRDTLLQLTSGEIVDAKNTVRMAGTVCVPVRELPRILRAVKRLAKKVS